MSQEALRIFPENKRPKITVGTLLSDNRSEWADETRRIWYTTKEAGNLTLLEHCGDSRTIIPNPDTVAIINYIAVGEAPARPQKNILQNPGVKNAVVIGHFDGETLKPGKMPKGCGGLAAKENQMKSPEVVSSLDYYIKNNVYHPDPIIQAIITAESLFALSEKPILAAAQDHRTGEIYPIALFATYQDPRGSQFDRGGIFALKSVSTSWRERNYDPKKIYEAGLPLLENHEVPQFSVFLSDDHEKVKRIKNRFPTHYENSKVQDPVMIDFTTRIIPDETCFPELGEEPGRIFGVFVPKKRISDDEVEIQPEELITSLSQIEFPIMQSLKNHGQNGKSFANTNTILIDTENFSISLNLATMLMAQSNAVREWVAIKGHKIIISKTTDGVITRIEEFKPNI